MIGLLAESGSWRLAYVVPGAISALALAGGSIGARAAGRGGAGGAREGLAAVFRDPSARRWTLAELVAYSAWTAELTYAAAFYIESYGVGEARSGCCWLSARSSSCSCRRTPRGSRALAAQAADRGSALLMGVTLMPVLNLTPSVWFTLALFCVMASFAALRSTTPAHSAWPSCRAGPGA